MTTAEFKDAIVSEIRSRVQSAQQAQAGDPWCDDCDHLLSEHGPEGKGCRHVILDESTYERGECPCIRFQDGSRNGTTIEDLEEVVNRACAVVGISQPKE